MKQYNEQELDVKIHAFLTEKLRKYPELTAKPRAAYSTVEPSMPVRLIASFTWFKSLATH